MTNEESDERADMWQQITTLENRLGHAIGSPSGRSRTEMALRVRPLRAWTGSSSTAPRTRPGSGHPPICTLCWHLVYDQETWQEYDR